MQQFLDGIHIRRGLRFANGQEAAGRILVSDSAGNLLYQDQATGGGGTGILPQAAFVVGRWYINTLSRGVAFTTEALVADYVYFMPFPIEGVLKLWIDVIGINVTTAATSGTFSANIGIYDSQNGHPSILLHVATVTGLNAVGTKTVSMEVSFEAGRLYFLAVHVGCNVTLRAMSGVNALVYGSLNDAAATTFTHAGRMFRTFGFGLPSSINMSDMTYSIVQAAIQVVMRAVNPPAPPPDEPPLLGQ